MEIRNGKNGTVAASKQSFIVHISHYLNDFNSTWLSSSITIRLERRRTTSQYTGVLRGTCPMSCGVTENEDTCYILMCGVRLFERISACEIAEIVY